MRLKPDVGPVGRGTLCASVLTAQQITRHYLSLPGHRFILGNVPPPIGGVSTFVHRHLSVLERSGVAFTHHDWLSMSMGARAGWLLQILLSPRKIHLEFNAYETWAMLAVLLRPFPVEITLRIHSGGPESRFNRWRHVLLDLFLRRVDNLILVGPHVRGVMERAGYRLPSEAEIQPAFLPPPPEDEDTILESYGAEGLAFLNSHSPLLVLQGSDAFQDGVDLYGSDLAIRALVALRASHPNAGLIIGRPSPGNPAFQNYCRSLEIEAEEAEAIGAIWILDGERQMWPVIKRSSVFLRPTTSDGDSISLREALHFGVPVVASDAAPRPEGSILFASRDQEDLNRAILEALQTREAPCS